MKDNRFIELVNLYIDRQISGEEMATLEAEMQANPRRRAVYREYCQMHRATTLVYESFRTDQTGQQSKVAAAEAKVARFESPHRGRRPSWTYYAAGLAAACVALVFARMNSSRISGQNGADALGQPAQLAAAVASQSTMTPVPAAAVLPQAIPVKARSNSLLVERDYPSMLASMRQEDQRAYSASQLQPQRSQSLFEDGVFDSQLTDSPRVFRSNRTSSQSEFTAFQFQR